MNHPAAPSIEPLRLARFTHPFDDPAWIFELKHDGFRALAYIDGPARLISRNGNTFRQFDPLCRALGGLPPCILDGEIVCVDEHGRPQFYDLLRRRAEPRFFAFDLLWLRGRDLRGLPLVERKRRLRKLIPAGHSHLLYVQHVGQGTELYRVACEQDLEGIVAKMRQSPYDYLDEKPHWLKIKNPNYSQKDGRWELLERKSAGA